jgi:hypothetical protein
MHTAPKWCLTALVAGMLATGCSPKLAPEGHYQKSPVTADGSATDWTLPLRFSNSSFTLQYNVTNDDNNLYVCVSSGNESAQTRILRAGMTLYFDPKGEKNKDINIHFPIQKHADPGSYHQRGGNGGSGGSGNGGSGSNRNSGPSPDELLLQSDYYNTTGFLEMENGQFALTDQKSPIRLAIKFNNDSLLVYEAIIPIKNILGPDWASKAAKKNFSVGVFLDATPAMGGGGGGARPGMGMRGMGMRGVGGIGGMGGGRRYGGGGGGGQEQKEDANWYVFRMAIK